VPEPRYELNRCEEQTTHGLQVIGQRRLERNNKQREREEEATQSSTMITCGYMSLASLEEWICNRTVERLSKHGTYEEGLSEEPLMVVGLHPWWWRRQWL
jgi:hypothetical protein